MSSYAQIPLPDPGKVWKLQQAPRISLGPATCKAFWGDSVEGGGGVDASAVGGGYITFRSHSCALKTGQVPGPMRVSE